MKVLCPHCERLLSLTSFRLDGGALVVTCTGCGQPTRVEEQSAPAPVRAPAPSSAPRVSLASLEGASNVVVLRTAGHEAVSKAALAADEGPFTVPEGVCPRCIARRGEGDSCPQCGVRFDQFDEAVTLPPRWLRDDWVELLRDWGNAGRHTQLRRKAQQLDALAAVGRLYRLRLVAVPEDPVAAEGREDIVRLAQVSLSFGGGNEDTGQRRVMWLTLAGVVLLLMMALAGLARR